MTQSKGTQLNCFSPPVMIATLVIEFSLAIYTLVRYKLTVLTRLITLTLLMLGTFQLAEYFVCRGTLGHTEAWSRLGFAAITVLPPLGFHLAHVLANKPNRRLVWTAYATMAGFIAFFLLTPSVFNNHQCTGNYVIFHLRPNAGGFYWIYYMGWIFTTIFLCMVWSDELKKLGAKAVKQLQTVRALIIGQLVFLVPTAIANIVNPETRAGIPSVMCGFAVLFALILGFYILPRAAQPKN